MARFIDPLITNNLLDANIFDEIAGGKEILKEILRMSDEDGITLLIPYSVQQELENAETPASVRKAAVNFIFSMKVGLTKNEQALYDKILNEARGEADPKNIDRDLFHVFEAAKYGGHFITRDKRLLKRASVIFEMLQLELLTPEAFFEKVRAAKQREAEFAKRRQGSE